jgi:hypothetical protein
VEHYGRLVFALALTTACVNPTSRSPNAAGTWAENFSFPGASLILTVDASGNWNGTDAIEAGHSGLVHVTGTVAQTMVALTIQYDYGPVWKSQSHGSGFSAFVRMNPMHREPMPVPTLWVRSAAGSTLCDLRS